MTVEDWEVGALYWRLVDEGAGPEEAAEKVKQKFLGEICAPEKETYFYVGRVLKWPEVVGCCLSLSRWLKMKPIDGLHQRQHPGSQRCKPPHPGHRLCLGWWRTPPT